MIFDVVVIGGGQAGLSMGYFLKKSHMKFIILDNQKRIGDSWRKRYDSLVLFTPRSHSSLPGLPLEGAQNVFPTKDEMADYLERYARTFDLPIQCEVEVEKVYKEGGIFYIQTGQSVIQAKRVIIATGPFQTPRIPTFSKKLPQEIVQLHSSQYKNSSQLKEGSVLVVGGGNSGTQIAVELSKTHDTFLSVGQKIRFLPLSLAGKSIFWWFEKIGILKANRHSTIGKRFKKLGDPIFGYELKEKIKNQSVKLKGRSTTIHTDEVVFEDGSKMKVENIIWATGFVSEYPWLHIPNVMTSSGQVRHERGITEINGLYFLGLPWQYRRGSALILGVGDDAEYLMEHINH
ncbi:flavin-containing monooxygenase [Bacillus sp. CGMCC 1.16607]|uniref:flavin-containing monooxygenase n=1 Tax=Bacillus sp. CGMCC 1.16607 TaxID=3351842 RepID=UPI0036366248